MWKGLLVKVFFLTGVLTTHQAVNGRKSPLSVISRDKKMFQRLTIRFALSESW